MFIYMSALIFNPSFNLIRRIGFFFSEEFEISFLSLCILKHETFDIDDLSSMQDDPLCILCMS